MKKFDLIVIGAGPAGALTAYHTSKLGLNVLVIENRKFPRVKPCGGGLTMRSLRYIPFSIDHLIKRRNFQILFSNKQEKKKIKCSARSLLSVQIIRSEFDNYLLNRAEKIGSKIICDKKISHIIDDSKAITVVTNSNTYNTKYLCVADGSNSLTRKLLNIECKKKSGFAIEGDISNKFVNIDNANMEFFFKKHESHYCWIFPKDNHINVGVYSYNIKKIKLNRTFLFEFVKDNFSLNPETIENIRGFPINFDFKNNEHSNQNIFFVGDAAGFAEPLLGEGIHHAVKSAYYAGLSLKEVINGSKKSLNKIYLKKCNDIIFDVIFCKYLAKGFYRKSDLGFILLSNMLIKFFFKKTIISARPTFHIVRYIFSLPFWSKCKQVAVKTISKSQWNT